MARGHALCRNPATGTARALAWAFIRKAGRSGFALDDVLAATGAGTGHVSQRSNLRKYLSALVADGVLEVTATKNGKAARYLLLRDPGPRSPVLRAAGGITDPNRRERRPVTSTDQTSARARAWAAMRNMGQRRQAFTVDEIARLLGDRLTLTANANLRGYLRALARFGYLRTRRTGRHVSYRMMRDTGPQSPILRGDGRLYDPNLARDVEEALP